MGVEWFWWVAELEVLVEIRIRFVLKVERELVDMYVKLLLYIEIFITVWNNWNRYIIMKDAVEDSMYEKRWYLEV